MQVEKEPKILAILCKWCSYAGADLAGTSRFIYPANVRIVQVPCSGRVDPIMIFKAFVEGYDGVMVSGCHPGDCHYGTGNYHARRRIAVARRLLEFVGVHPDRMHFTWISAAEGKKFADVCSRFTDELKALSGTEKTLARKELAT
ncbi:MAG: hydrogenase iron-sulfur subunit [candidate division WOR-3 bacterium]|nr:MAG: hydrogenase iron-sulfur subunit [candidate division WOR-3 bacterium]